MNSEWVNSILATDKFLFAATCGSGVFRSDDSGVSWTSINSGINDLNIKVLAIKTNSIYAGTNVGDVYISENDGDSWDRIGSVGICVNSIVLSDRGIFLGTDKGVFYSNDNGKNWTDISSKLPVKRVYSLFLDSTSLFAGTYFGGIFLSVDEGASWTEVNSGINPYLGCIEIPVETIVPNFTKNLPAVPVVDSKPVLDKVEMAVNEAKVIEYDGIKVFPEISLLQLEGHVTGEAS